MSANLLGATATVGVNYLLVLHTMYYIISFNRLQQFTVVPVKKVYLLCSTVLYRCSLL